MYQGSLFGPQEVPKAMPGIPGRTPGVKNPVARTKREPKTQQTLDFLSTVANGSRILDGSVPSAIYCSAQVAIAPLRIAAATADVLLSATGVFLCGLVAHFFEKDLPLDSLPLSMYAIACISIFVLYRLFFCLANSDTPGIRWAGLRMVNFDGRRPTARQRFYRLAGGWVSLVAAGLGLIWALFDEERLTWHDHMSQTFPSSTYVAARPQI